MIDLVGNIHFMLQTLSSLMVDGLLLTTNNNNNNNNNNNK